MLRSARQMLLSFMLISFPIKSFVIIVRFRYSWVINILSYYDIKHIAIISLYYSITNSAKFLSDNDEMVAIELRPARQWCSVRWEWILKFLSRRRRMGASLYHSREIRFDVILCMPIANTLLPQFVCNEKLFTRHSSLYSVVLLKKWRDYHHRRHRDTNTKVEIFTHFPLLSRAFIRPNANTRWYQHRARVVMSILPGENVAERN